MIVVDTSALVAVLLGEHGSDELERQLLENRCVMSAATRVEVGIVIEAKAGPAGTLLLDELIARVGIDISPVDEELADQALVAWRRFGKGRHRAALNYGDTFSYALARGLGQPLLFTGDDFAHTDIAVP